MSALLPFDASLGLVSVTQAEHESVGGYVYPAQLHYSYDFGLAVGTDVLAIEGGTVFSVVNNVPDGQTMAPLNSGLDAVTYPQLGPGGTGNQVTIYHPSLGLYVTYAHLAQGSVPYMVEQTVAQGAVLGETGLTGTGTGPHLHITYGTSVTDWGGSTSNVYSTTQIANGAVAANPAGFELVFDEAGGQPLMLSTYQSNNGTAVPSDGPSVVFLDNFNRLDSSDVGNVGLNWSRRSPMILTTLGHHSLRYRAVF